MHIYELLPVIHLINASQISSAQLQLPSIYLLPYVGYGHLNMKLSTKYPFWRDMNLKLKK